MKRLAVLSCLLAVPPGAAALGIRLFDHDAFATARGNAFVATADNPSALYYNPAGISQLDGHNVRGGLYTVNVHSEFEPTLSDGTFENRDDLVPLPGIYYVYGATNLPISFGAAYYQPYGLSLEWPDSTPFRSVITEGSLEYHTFSGVVAWEICPALSIAAGPTFNYSKSKLQRGTAAQGDRFAFRGDDYSWGGVAGLLWQPAERHSFGISYRTKTTADLKGESRVATYPAWLSGASLDMSFPQVIVGGYSFRPSKDWNLEVDVDWTDWDQVRSMVLRQPGGNALLPMDWQSSWGVAVGATRYLANGLHVSAGYSFIEESTPTRTFNPLVPDQDMHVFSAGLGGQIEQFTWDATYQFTWGPGRSVAGSVNGAAVAGDYSYAAHAISLSFGWRF